MAEDHSNPVMTPIHSKPPPPEYAALMNRSSLASGSPVRSFWLAIVLAVVTAALYWPAVHCGFIGFDDPKYVISNAHVQGGLTLPNAAWAFTTGQMANWHPITWLSLMLDVDLFGHRPAGFHFSNLMLHTLNVVLLFYLLRQLTGAIWRSALVAALFGWHPLHVESVAWISERKDVLSTCFGFLSLWFYAGYAQGRGVGGEEKGERREDGSGTRSSLCSLPSSAAYWLALFCYALGLMSKPMLVTWPFVLLLLDFWPLGRLPPLQPLAFSLQPFRPLWPLWREKIPFLVLVPPASVVTFLVQQHGGAVASMEHLTLGLRFENALVSYCGYLGKLFWPVNLAFFYPHPGKLPGIKVLLASVFLIGFSGFLFQERRRLPYLLMGWWWFLGTLVPVIGLVQVGEQAMADRYMYIPSVGMLIMIIWGAHALVNCWIRRPLPGRGSVIRSRLLAKPCMELDSPPPPDRSAAADRAALPGKRAIAAFAVIGLVVLIFCLALTRQQLGYWQNSETLYRHALAVTKNNQLAHVNLGAALIEAGRDDEAIGEIREALRLRPNDAGYLNDLGIVLFRKGRTDESLNQFQAAIRIDPNNAFYHANLGNLLAANGQTNAALGEWQAAIRLQPDFVQAHYNLALALARLGRTSEAIDHWEFANQFHPGDVLVHSNLALAFATEGQTESAIHEWQEVLRLNPTNASIHDNLGNLLARTGQDGAAIIQFQEALRLNPDNAKACDNLGIVLLKQGRTNEAVRQFQAAIRLQPNFAKAHDNLGFLLAGQGRREEAIREWREVLRLRPGYPEAQSNLTRALELKSGLDGGSPPP